MNATQAIDNLLMIGKNCCILARQCYANIDICGVMNFIAESKRTIDALTERLRELDEKNQTQAMVLAARDKVIEQQVTIQHAYRDEMAALKKDLSAARRCGSCKWWDVHDRRCYNSKSHLLKVLCVLRFQACDFWEDLRECYKQRDSE